MAQGPGFIKPCTIKVEPVEAFLLVPINLRQVACTIKARACTINVRPPRGRSIVKYICAV